MEQQHVWVVCSKRDHRLFERAKPVGECNVVGLPLPFCIRLRIFDRAAYLQTPPAKSIKCLPGSRRGVEHVLRISIEHMNISDFAHLRLIPFYVIVAIIGGACSESGQLPSPRELPYRLEVVQERTGPIFLADLEGDGRDEILRYSGAYNYGSKLLGQPKSIVLETWNGKVIEQVNYAWPVHAPHTSDLTGNGTLEVLVPFVRRDSLFMSVVDGMGHKIEEFYVTSGHSRVEPEGTMPWDPEVLDVFASDIDGNGRRELVTIVETHFARLPRGVFIHRWPSGEFVGKQVVGATLRQRKVGQFDGDAYQELLIAGPATNNGAEAGGMSDRNAYIYTLEIGPMPRVQWKRLVGGVWAWAHICTGDLDADGARDYIAFASQHRKRPRPSEIRRIDPATGDSYLQTTLSEPIRNAIMVDIDSKPGDDIVALGQSGRIYVLGSDLQVTRTAQFTPDARNLLSLSDLDGNGNDEILLQTTSRTIMLGPNLEARAIAHLSADMWERIQYPDEKFPLLHARHREGSVTLRVQKNPYYWLYRYGLWGGGLFAAVLALGAGWVGLRHHDRWRRLRALPYHIVDAVGQGLLLVGPRKDIKHANARARVLLRLDRRVNHGSVVQHVPKLAALIDDTAARDGPRQERVTLQSDRGEQINVHISITPFTPGNDKELWWLIALSDEASSHQANREGEDQAWGLMARRVAHDLKNPLTSILLTLQRMQMEYQERAPEKLARDLDQYETRVEERIERLRQMTTNLMKFIGAEEPTRVQVDLSGFLQEQIDAIRGGVPPDVTLTLQENGDDVADLPPVRVDSEQMESVLENLISNAVKALPEGGRVTVSVHVEQGLRWSSDEAPTDYVILEVRDTGVGIDKDTKEQIFDPGFSTEKDGTGLGLAIVRKVVRDHGGHVEVESEPGVGSAFCIYLPVESNSSCSV